MQLYTLIAIGVIGFYILILIEKRKRSHLTDLKNFSNSLAKQTEEIGFILDNKLKSVIDIVSHGIHLLEPQSFIIQLPERVIYTKRTIKTFYDASSKISFAFTTPEKILAIGVEIDPNEFKVLLKEKEKNKTIAEFSELIRNIASQQIAYERLEEGKRENIFSSIRN